MQNIQNSLSISKSLVASEQNSASPEIEIPTQSSRETDVFFRLLDIPASDSESGGPYFTKVSPSGHVVTSTMKEAVTRQDGLLSSASILTDDSPLTVPEPPIAEAPDGKAPFPAPRLFVDLESNSQCNSAVISTASTDQERAPDVASAATNGSTLLQEAMIERAPATIEQRPMDSRPPETRNLIGNETATDHPTATLRDSPVEEARDTPEPAAIPARDVVLPTQTTRTAPDYSPGSPTVDPRLSRDVHLDQSPSRSATDSRLMYSERAEDVAPITTSGAEIVIAPADLGDAGGDQPAGETGRAEHSAQVFSNPGFQVVSTETQPGEDGTLHSGLADDPPPSRESSILPTEEIERQAPVPIVEAPVAHVSEPPGRSTAMANSTVSVHWANAELENRKGSQSQSSWQTAATVNLSQANSQTLPSRDGSPTFPVLGEDVEQWTRPAQEKPVAMGADETAEMFRRAQEPKLDEVRPLDTEKTEPVDRSRLDTQLTAHEEAGPENRLPSGTVGRDSGIDATAARLATANGSSHVQTLRTAAAQIAEITRNVADGKLEVRLSPEELGRLSISFSARDTGLAVTILAERPETVELVRRNVDSLMQELRDQGFGQLSVDIGSSRQEDSTHHEGDSNAIAVVEPETAEEDLRGMGAPDARITTNGLDLRL
ncbi:flagellar hook-length control protein FliK [Tropicimonas marinistellae]|uniref:flagellar hook-length control protein FliK n=1 Tax=Tropicimonas marinistellae TaxID=1739787 RepID=UPI00098F1E19|nr:flagellar hook-length control protein FliK [Tropicimonas marinistellae]